MIKDYLNTRKKFFALWFFPCILFPVLGYLWNSDLEPIFYGIVLMTALFLVILVVDYSRYYQKRRNLQRIQEELDSCPHLSGSTLIGEEADYLGIILGLWDLLQKQNYQREEMLREERQYYSLWVHQIKTPISAMSLALEGQTISKALMEQEIFKVRQYVEMALNYIKLSDFSSDMVIDSYNLEDLVSKSLKKCATLFIHKGIGVKVEPMEKTLFTDEKWSVFILEQILTNAVKYTPQGSVTISLEGDTLKIADTGIGIAAEDIERIFEMGFTGYNGRLDKNASGIGLYLVNQVAKALSIEVSVTSKVNQGTMVSLTFPKNPTMVYAANSFSS